MTTDTLPDTWAYVTLGTDEVRWRHDENPRREVRTMSNGYTSSPEWNADIECTIDADCSNYCGAVLDGRHGIAERDAYTLLRTLHRELPTERVQQVLAGVSIADVLP